MLDAIDQLNSLESGTRLMIYFAFLLVLLLTIFLVYRYQERSLYLLFLAAYSQNFIVAFLHTHGYIGLELARALIVTKDLVLLELFVWSVILLFKRFRPPLPRPLVPLLFLTGYCTFRFVVGVFFLGDDWWQGVTLVRYVWYPLEILLVVMVLTALYPGFGRRFLRDMTYILSGLAVVAIGILIFAPRDFWLENANIAELQVDVKGESEHASNSSAMTAGLSTDTMLGDRSDEFGVLLNFRASGTFGEALALAFSVAAAVLLLLFYFKKSLLSVLSLTFTVGALLLSLTRSAWIFCAVVAVYVLIRRRRFRPLLVGAWVVLTLFLAWPPLANFASDSVSELSGGPQTGHAEGIVWFYTRELLNLENIVGKGMATEAQTIYESGYAYLLEHFGLIAYASFLWFCVSLYRQLRRACPGADGLSTLAQGVPLGILIVMHFWYYPFAPSFFGSIWYIVGLCLGNYLVPRKELAGGAVEQRRQAPSLLPA